MDVISQPRQIKEKLLTPEHFSDETLARLADNYCEFSSLKARLANINRGPAILKKQASDEYHTFMRCGQRAWQRISMKKNSSIRDFRLRNFVVQKWFHEYPICSKHTSWSSPGARYVIDNLSPTVMPMLTSAEVATITFKGSGQLVLFSMGRIGIPDIAITLKGAKSLYRPSDLTLSLDVSTATEFEPVYSVIANDLPYDEYTVTITSSGSPITTCFPICLGIEFNEQGLPATPYSPVNDRISVMPYKTFMTETSGASWHDITGTNAKDSINQAVTYALTAGADHIYIGVNEKASRTAMYEDDNDLFDKVELTFVNANAGAGGDTIAQYWNGAWTDLNIIEDTMWAGSLPLAQDGHIVFEVPSDWTYNNPNGLGYGRYIRLGSSSNTSGIRLATAEVRMAWNAAWPYAEGTLVDSEMETAINRAENPSNDDVGGGHGNVNRTAFAVYVDGVDVSSIDVGDDPISGSIIEFEQAVDMYSDEPPSGSVVGDYTFAHKFCAGMVSLHGQINFTSFPTTIYPWGYLVMMSVPTTYFSLKLMGANGKELEVLVSGMSYGVPAPNAPPQEFCGGRFTHAGHPFSIGALQMQSQSVNKFFRHSESKTFGLLTTNVKMYQMLSGGPTAWVITEPTTINFENLYFMSPMR